MIGGRKLSNWNLFVKKIYKEGKLSNPSYKFKEALSDASKRKSEMNNMGQGIKTKKITRSSRKMALAGGRKMSRRLALAGGKSRKSRKH